MPELNFKGKQIVYAHHLTVPLRTFEADAKKSVLPKGEKPSADGNLIVHGDNLHALKALMPLYAGRVNCIYIDPPYNTGNENWIYNDNVNSPMVREWLNNQKPVDNEDLERHDKWLCMMWPRLNLLRELLAEDGVIFVSIDDNEQHRLRMIMDEIFGEGNFVTNIVWQKKYAPANDAKYFSDNHDFVVCYAKNRNGKNNGTAVWERRLLPRTDKQNKLYKYDDNDGRGPWSSSDLTAKTYSPDYDYLIVNPATGKEHAPPVGRSWMTSKKTMQSWIDDNKVFFPSGGRSVPRLKNYLREVQQGVVPLTIWTYDEVGHTDGARKALKEIFSEQQLPFDNPKASGLLRRIFTISGDKNAIVLDSFAGSGTTAQAVLELNKEDGGNRKFILVECENKIADKITAERVRRVIKGVPKSKDGNLKKGLGGSFAYCALGEEINPENMLTGKNLPDYETLARHLFWTATGKSPDKIRKARGKDGFFHETEDRMFFLIYEPELKFLQNPESALNSERAERISKQAKKKKKTAIVFATHKFMGQKELTEMGITFAQLPYACGGG